MFSTWTFLGRCAIMGIATTALANQAAAQAEPAPRARANAVPSIATLRRTNAPASTMDHNGGVVLAANTGKLVSVPEGLLVRVVLERDVSPAKSQDGDAFAIHALRDVAVDGYIVVKAGAPGRGRLVSPGGDTPGELTLAIDYIVGVDGKKIRLTRALIESHNVSANNATSSDDNAISNALSNAAAAKVNQATAAHDSTGALGTIASSIAGNLFGHHPKTSDVVLAANTIFRSHVAAAVHTFSTFPSVPDTTESEYAH